MIGEKYNRLLIIGEGFIHTFPSGQKKRKVEVKCDCGKTKFVLYEFLRSGHSKSCGCYSIELTIKASVTHHKSGHPLYKLFNDLKKRCYNQKFKYYKDYGGRGIFICDEWLNDFMLFYNWCNENGYQKGLQIDRRDNNRGYSPDNCRFVTSKVNNRNRRSSKMITYKGETKPLCQWCEELGIPAGRVHHRLKLGWDVERAFTVPNIKDQQIAEKEARGGYRKNCKYLRVQPKLNLAV